MYTPTIFFLCACTKAYQCSLLVPSWLFAALPAWQILPLHLKFISSLHLPSLSHPPLCLCLYLLGMTCVLALSSDSVTSSFFKPTATKGSMQHWGKQDQSWADFLGARLVTTGCGVKVGSTRQAIAQDQRIYPCGLPTWPSYTSTYKMLL